MLRRKKFWLPLIGLLFSLISNSLLISCSKDEAPEPEPPKLVPEIEDISPKAGVYRMRVSIKGKNFDKIPEQNIVKFAEVQAKVVYADENLLEVEVPADGTTGPVTVSAQGTRVTGPSFKYYDLYLVGNYGLGFFSAIKLWKNGVVEPITSETEYNYATSIAVSGNDIFFTGQHFDGSKMVLAYWKNKQFNPISDKNGWASDICVSNGDVYVAGNEDNGSGYNAKYWKGTFGVDLTSSSYDLNDHASTISVVDGDLYAGGLVSLTSWQSVATYWKNGISVTIGDEIGSSRIIDMVVVGRQMGSILRKQLQ